MLKEITQLVIVLLMCMASSGVPVQEGQACIINTCSTCPPTGENPDYTLYACQLGRMQQDIHETKQYIEEYLQSTEPGLVLSDAMVHVSSDSTSSVPEFLRSAYVQLQNLTLRFEILSQFSRHYHCRSRHFLDRFQPIMCRIYSVLRLGAVGENGDDVPPCCVSSSPYSRHVFNSRTMRRNFCLTTLLETRSVLNGFLVAINRLYMA